MLTATERTETQHLLLPRAPHFTSVVVVFGNPLIQQFHARTETLLLMLIDSVRTHVLAVLI